MVVIVGNQVNQPQFQRLISGDGTGIFNHGLGHSYRLIPAPCRQRPHRRLQILYLLAVERFANVAAVAVNGRGRPNDGAGRHGGHVGSGCNHAAGRCCLPAFRRNVNNNGHGGVAKQLHNVNGGTEIAAGGVEVDENGR